MSQQEKLLEGNTWISSSKLFALTRFPSYSLVQYPRVLQNRSADSFPGQRLVIEPRTWVACDRCVHSDWKPLPDRYRNFAKKNSDSLIAEIKILLSRFTEIPALTLCRVFKESKMWKAKFKGSILQVAYLNHALHVVAVRKKSNLPQDSRLKNHAE